MKIKKIFCAVMAFVLAATLVPVNTLTSEAASINAPKSVTLVSQKGNIVGFSVESIPGGQQIDVSSVKSSNKSVATISSVSEYAYPETDYDFANGNVYIYLKIVKFGTTKVSYKIGSKTYTTTVKLKDSKSSAYTNPLSSLTISGVNGGKNIASKFKKKSEVKGLKLSSTQKNGKIKVKAKKGWKISYVYVSDYDGDGGHYIGKSTDGGSSYTIDGFELEKKSKTYHTVEFSLQKGSKSVWLSVTFN